MVDINARTSDGRTALMAAAAKAEAILALGNKVANLVAKGIWVMREVPKT